MKPVFDEAKEFIKDMMDEYKISEPGTHVSVVEYSDVSSVKLGLRDSFDENAIKDEVDRMTLLAGGSTNLDRALENVVDKMFSVSLGGRPSAKKILVVLAASNTSAKEALKKVEKPLKELGVRIYVVPLGDDKKKDPKELAKLVDEDILKSRFGV